MRLSLAYFNNLNLSINYFLTLRDFCRAGRYEVDGYVYNAAEEPQILMTGKWNGSMSYQPCDMEGEPRAGTELKEVSVVFVFF